SNRPTARLFPLLKAQLHRKLTLPHGRIEKETGDHACRGRADTRSGRGELRMIEGVERFNAKLMPELLAEARFLHEREVELDLAGRLQDIASRVSVCSRVICRRLEG